MNDSSIDSLVARARRGDQEAVGELLTQWQTELSSFVRQRAGRALLEKESRADIIQSACREVLTSLEGAELQDGREGFKGWLFKATLRKIIDRHRYWVAAKRDRKRDVHPDWTRASIDQLVGTGTSPGSAAERAELADRVRAIVASLPEHYEEVLRLSHFDGLSRRDVAIRLGISESGVSSLLARAMARLTRLVHTQLGRE